MGQAGLELDGDVRMKEVLNRGETKRRRILFNARDRRNTVYIDCVVIFLLSQIPYDSFYLPIHVKKRKLKQKCIIVITFYTGLKPNYNF